MIQSVIFDLGRVIVPIDFSLAYRRVEQLSGIPAADVPRRIAATGLVDEFESGRIAPRDFARALTQHLGFTATYEEFCDLWSSIFLPQPLIPPAVFESLASRYRLVLLSNTNAIHFEMIRENYPLLSHFHAFVLSYEVGVMKPEAAIYNRAIAEARCAAAECVFIDDLAVNVDAARRQGMDAVQFHSAQQLANELVARGIPLNAAGL